MKILDSIISIRELEHIEPERFFDDMEMMKAVADIDRSP